jgi:hypothetical protein
MPISDNLTESWELDEASGNAIASVTPTTNDLTDTNGVGAAGAWRDFELDSTQYFTHADNADLSLGDHDATIVVDVQMESKAGEGAANGIIFKNTTEYAILYDNGWLGFTDRFMLRLHSGTNGLSIAANNLGSPSLSTPYHIVAQYDATADEASIRVNNGTPNTGSLADGIQNGAGDFLVGSANGTAFPFDGLIRRVRIWKRKLTAEELTWLYNSGTGRTYAELLAGMGDETPFFTRIGAIRVR